jgi:hypothetical protein
VSVVVEELLSEDDKLVVVLELISEDDMSVAVAELQLEEDESTMTVLELLAAAGLSEPGLSVEEV